MKFRIRQNKYTYKWEVHEKIMLFIGKLTWVIDKSGMNSKQEAQEYLDGKEIKRL